MSVVAMTARNHPTANQPVKDLYEVGEIPPLGHVPASMYAWAIRRERHGPPEHRFSSRSCRRHSIPIEVLVMVMAAGVNYNGVWAGLGRPISPFDVHKEPYHIAGSDASGIVWAVGAKVRRWKVGDEVVIHCNQADGDDEECNGGDPMFSHLAAHLGLRDAGRLLRPVQRGAGPAADAARAASDLGRERLLYADARHLLSHAVRPSPAYPAARPQRAGLGRLGRHRLHGGAADRHGRAPMPSASSPTIEDAISSCSSAPRASSTATISIAGARCPMSTMSRAMPTT